MIKIKKILALVMMAAVIITGVSAAMSAGAVTEGGMTYTEKSGGLAVTGVDNTLSGALVIPGTVDGKPVVEIDKNVFANNTQITSVSVPASVKKIGNKAFYGCAMIDSVVFEESGEIVSLGEEVFGSCTSLKNLILPKKMTSVPRRAFAACALPGVTIPEGVVSVGDEAFINNQSLKSAKIPGSVSSIGKHVFLGCANLEEIAVDGSNQDYISVDGSLFSKDKTELIQYALGKAVSEYTVPDGVKEIGSGAFAFSSLVKMNLPEGLETIGYEAFMDSTALNTVNLPSTLTVIDESAFYHCYALDEITVPASVTEFSSAFAYSGLEKAVIENGVETIPNDAFTGCKSLKEVVIPESVTKIESAFIDCESLEEITIPSSVTEISNNAFDGSENTTIVAPEGSYAEQYAGNNDIDYKKPGPAVDEAVLKVVITAPSGRQTIRWKFRARLVAKAKLPAGYSLKWFDKDGKSYNADFTTDNLTSGAEYTVKIVDSNGNPVSTSSQEKKVIIEVKSDFFTKIISFISRLFGSDTITL